MTAAFQDPWTRYEPGVEDEEPRFLVIRGGGFKSPLAEYYQSTVSSVLLYDEEMLENAQADIGFRLGEVFSGS